MVTSITFFFSSSSFGHFLIFGNTQRNVVKVSYEIWNFANPECKPNITFIFVYKVLTEISGNMVFPLVPQTWTKFSLQPLNLFCDATYVSKSRDVLLLLWSLHQLSYFKQKKIVLWKIPYPKMLCTEKSELEIVWFC